MGGCKVERLTNYILSPAAISMVSGSSKGTQTKYYDGGYWYKINNIGSESTSEYLASLVLSCSNITDYVSYEKCMINGKLGCRSRNFLKDGENYVSIQRLYDLYVGGDLTDVIYSISDVSERIKYVVDFVKEVTGLDIYDYLAKMLSFDALILNTDRHFHNIGVICDANTNEYRLAPVFDNGNSLLSNYSIFPFEETIDDNISKVVGKPFAANLEYQAHCFSYGLKIDYKRLKKLLAHEEVSRCLQVLEMQLHKYEKLFRMDMKSADLPETINDIDEDILPRSPKL